MPDIRYTFSAAGQAGVLNAFRSIEQSAKRTKRSVEQSTGMGRAAGAGGRGAAGAAGEQIRAVKAVERAQRQAQLRAARHQLRLLKQQERARLQTERRVQREAERAARKTERARLRAERRARREAERTAKRQQRAAESQRKARSRMIRQIAGRVAGGALRGIGAVGLAATGVVGLAARQGIETQDRAVRLAIKGGTIGRRVDPNTLRKEAESIAQNVRGAKAGGVLAAQERFVAKTGRLDLARQFGEEFAKIAVATGTEFEAIGSAAADMFEKFDIKTVDDMGKSLALLAIQGKRGAFEMEDAASQFPKIASAAARFGLSGVKGLATLGGLSQIARRATPSGEEAATAVENMFKQLIAKSGMIRKDLGVSVFKDKGKTQTREVEDLLVDIIGGAKGNLPKLQEIFDIRGIRAVSPLISLFNKTRQQELEPTKGKATPAQEAAATAVAMARLRQEISDATNVTAAKQEIDEDTALAQQQTSATLTAAWESLVAQVNDNFTPGLIESVQKIAGFVEETDFSGVATVFDALAESAGLAADALDALGILPKKKKTPEQLIKEQERVIAKTGFEQERLTREVGGARGFRLEGNRRRLQAITNRRLAAEAKIEQIRASVYQGTGVAAGQELLGTGDFRKRLQEQGVSAHLAGSIEERLVADPNAANRAILDLRSAQGVSGLLGMGDTEEQLREQRRLVEQFAMSRTAMGTLLQPELTKEQRAAMGPGGQEVGGKLVAGAIDPDEANAKLNEFAGALSTAISAVSMMKTSALAEAL